MDKETFSRLLQQGKIQTQRAPAGKADWKKILKKALKDGGIYTTKQFWTKFVKGAVNKGRTKMKLHEWCDVEHVCGRIWDKDAGTYVWIFDKELVKLYFEKVGGK